METTNSPHQPVLLEDVVTVLEPKLNDRYLDLTAGYGGHANAILSHSQNYQDSVLVDRDEMAIKFLSNRFKEHLPQIVHADMVEALADLKRNQKSFDMILIDAGVSSLQLDQAERGFSFMRSGPLDMRMDQSQTLSAAEIVNTWSEERIRRVLHDYGEEKQAKRIAKAIVEARPLYTTEELAEVVSKQIGGYSKIHPATRTFQGLRLAVNDELTQLADALPIAMGLLREGGRIAVISFHSLEDRIVKKFFAEKAGGRLDSSLELINTKPITAKLTDTNPRARSAKLRAAVKIKTQIGKE